MTILDAAQEWVEERYAGSEITEATARSYTDSLTLFCRHVGANLRVDEVTPQMIRSWIASQKRAGVKEGSIYTRLTAVRSFFKYLVAEDVLEANPCDKVKSPKVPRTVPRDLDPEDVYTVLDRITDFRTRLIIILAVQLGLRRAEIAGLRVDAVNLRSGTLIADGKGRRQRKLPLPIEVHKLLLAWIENLPPGSEWVFPSSKGGHLEPRSVGNLVAAAGAGAALSRRATTHTYRHTAAVEVLRSTGNVRTVQQMLGHANLATTSRYLGSDTSGLREAMEGRRYAGPTEEDTEP